MVIRKLSDSGFDGTELDAVLRRHHVTCLSVCGVLSEMCVAATVRSAMELGYEVVLAHDSHATYPVPALTPGDAAVPAEQAARAAEWSLGDGVVMVPASENVDFQPVAVHPAASGDDSVDETFYDTVLRVADRASEEGRDGVEAQRVAAAAALDAVITTVPPHVVFALKEDAPRMLAEQRRLGREFEAVVPSSALSVWCTSTARHATSTRTCTRTSCYITGC